MREKIAELTAQQRKQLAFAIDSSISQIVKFGNNEFIGVNVRCFKNINVLETAGLWTYGTIKN